MVYDPVPTGEETMYDQRLHILQFLNAATGFWYVVLSVGFFLALAEIHRAFVFKDDPRRKQFPTWWQKWGRKILALGYIGTSLFLAGCGFHHFHLAFEVVPNSVDLTRQFNVPLKENVWVGSHFMHHFIIMAGQFIGAPLLIFSGVLSAIAVKKRKFLS